MSLVRRLSSVLAWASLCKTFSPLAVKGFAPPHLSPPVRRSLMHAEARPGRFTKDFGGHVDLPKTTESLPPTQEKEELNHLPSKDFTDTNDGAKAEATEWFDITTSHGEEPNAEANDASPGIRHGRDSSPKGVDPLAKLMVGFSKAGLSQVTHAALLISLTLATVFAPLSPAAALDSGGRMGGAFVGGSSGAARQAMTRTYSSSSYSRSSYRLAPSPSYYNRGGYGSGSLYGSPRYYRSTPRPYYSSSPSYYGGARSGYYYGSSPMALGPAPRSYVAPLSPYAVAPTVVTSTPSVFDAFAIGAFLFFFTSL